MRVLQIVSSISINGRSSMIMNYYRNINRENIQFDFLVTKNQDKFYEEEILKLGGRVYYIDNPLSLKSLFKAKKNAKRFFKEHALEYGAVHLHSPTLAYFTSRYAKKYGIKTRICHSHSTMTAVNKIKRLINTFLNAEAIKYSNVYWACSKAAAEFLYGKKLGKSATIINNAIDLESFCYNEKAKADKPEWKNKTIVTHISNFAPIKNLFFMVDVIKEIVEQNKDYLFLFIGDGPQRCEFEKRLRDAGISDNCAFVGRTAEVWKYYQLSDLVALPSIKEGLPVTIVEAQACGIPCILSDTITREVNVGGASYVPLEKKKWVDAILNFSPYSEEQKRELAENMINSKFNIKKEAGKIEQLYLQLCRVQDGD